MKNTALTRIGGLAAAIALTATMTACSSGQSVAEACKIAQEELSTATSSISSDVNSAMQKATSGEQVDFAGLFTPITEGLDNAGKKITNESVKAPLTAFTTEYKSFVKVFDGFEIPDMKNFDATDADAMTKIQDAQKKAQEILTKVQEGSTKLTAQSKKLQDVCNKA